MSEPSNKRDEFMELKSGNSIDDNVTSEGLYDAQGSTGLTPSSEVVGEAAPPADMVADGRKEKLWIVITVLAFLLALLSSSLLNPMVAVQDQRVDQAEEVKNAVGLTNAAAAQALSEGGTFAAVESNRRVAEQAAKGLISADTLLEKISAAMFADSDANAALSTDWASYNTAANQFLAKRDEITQVQTKLEELSANIGAAVTESVDFVDAVAKEGTSKSSSSIKDRYLFLTSEASNLNGILGTLTTSIRNFYQSDSDLVATVDKQASLMVQLQDMLNRIVANSAAVVGTVAAPLRERYQQLETQVSEIGEGTSALVEARAALRDMRAEGEKLEGSLETASAPSATVRILSAIGALLPVVFGVLGVYGLYRYFTLQSRELVMHEANLSETLAEQQESILKLLDEMSALADGDLTVEAEVTDQITGAIADSVNFAVIEMRELVSQINRASIEVANESELAVNNAQSVSQSNMNQATQITAAAKLMQQVSESMRQMSEQAASSSEMAQDSQQAAEQGTAAVRDTIRGMENMREQIQETSKRIKRLGESSQRIGDIVALIDDIAEQTNILSLNAAIQASMAGEAGRGFAVVSDEVQSLAERSTEATRKIAELVATIQNDTNDAVLSMEKATQQVVSGTQVADSAGSALSAIEEVSNRLTKLVEGIAEGSTAQAEVVTQVSQQVSQVSESSTETSRKAQASANSIAKLLELAKDLETSVSRFKLPGA
ncbi:MAG: hypothetical protein HKN50_01820 [Gammaproteobacteria bacterium]|nr:hypothetical protein [Gammaproteobacteria bacterium]